MRAGGVTTVWELAEPPAAYFGGFTVGTWAGEREGCPECGRSYALRVAPLLMEWDVGARGVGDFTFAGFGAGFAIVVSREIGERLCNELDGVAAGPVEIVGRPAKGVDQEGLVELCAPTRVAFVQELSTVEVIDRCELCGKESLRFDGHETRTTHWSPRLRREQ